MPSKHRTNLSIDQEICKGCGLCVEACPRKLLQLAMHMNARGFHPAVFLSPDGCTACAQCAIMCPDACIRITKIELASVVELPKQTKVEMASAVEQKQSTEEQ